VEASDHGALRRHCEAFDLDPHGRTAVLRDRLRRFVVASRPRPPGTLEPSATASLLAALGETAPSLKLWSPLLPSSSPLPWLGTGRAFLGEGRPEEAAECFRKALELGGSGAARWGLLAAASALGRKDEAAREARALLAEESGDVRAHLWLAAYEEGAGRFAKARAHLEGALAVCPDAAPLHDWIGLLYLRDGEPRKALEAFAQSLAADPSSADGWNNRGVALLDTGQPDEAATAFAHALEIDPTHEVARMHHGVALVLAGRRAEGLRVLRDVCRDAPRWLDRLAAAYATGGRWDAVLTAARRAREAGHLTPSLRRLERRARAALRARRRRRREKMRVRLEGIRGVGPAKARALVDAGYETPGAVRAASVDDLARVPGISPGLARAIRGRFVRSRRGPRRR
jgi:tetratricopeptide (TPR) repeat protein